LSRERHKEELEFKGSLTFPSCKFTKDFKIPSESDLPKDIKVHACLNGQLVIEWKASRKVNAYLLRKGEKLAGKRSRST
jgi:hypothetical protein